MMVRRERLDFGNRTGQIRFATPDQTTLRVKAHAALVRLFRQQTRVNLRVHSAGDWNVHRFYTVDGPK